jgi:hypothetical protein
MGLHCERKAIYGHPGHRAEFCRLHRSNGTVNVINRKCEVRDCYVEPCFNYPECDRGRFCVSHKLENMIDIKNPKCHFDCCDKQATFSNHLSNKASEMPRLFYCGEHAPVGTINIKRAHKPVKMYDSYYRFYGRRRWTRFYTFSH